MRTRLALVILIVAAPALAACSGSTTSTGSDGGSTSTGPAASDRTGSTTAQPAGLEGTSWMLATTGGPAGATVDAAAGATASLTFAADGALSGSTGCNQFSGTYTLDGQNLTIELGPMTLMACADPLVESQQETLTRQLPEVTTWAISGETLTLAGADGTLFTYTATAAGLAGTSWQVSGINNGADAVVTTALTEALTLEFAADGTVTAFGGCNQMSGTFTTTDPDGVTISPLAGTMKSCGTEVDELETQFGIALGKVTTYDLAGGTLTLRDAGGATQVTASPAA